MRRLLAGIVALFLAASTACPTNADDSTIAQQLSAELRAAKESRELKSFRINVKVDDGVVWMQGSVLNAEQKSKALDIARAISGVRLVVNDLTLADGEVPDVAPPDPQLAKPIVAAKTAEVSEDQLTPQNATIKPVAMYRAGAQPKRDDSMVGPAKAMAGARRPSMPDPALIKQYQAQLAPQLMQAQMIRTQLLQRELAESQAIAAATEQLRRQNAIARSQLVNYCDNGGCRAGGDFSAGSGSAYGCEGAGTSGEGYPVGGYGGACYGGVGGECYGGEYGGECHGGQYAGGAYGGEYAGGGYGGEYGGAYGGGVVYDQAQLPGYAWPSYAAHPNYAALSYPKQYSPQAWPYIGPFYPYPQVPLGWRKVSLEWDDGWWMLDFTSKSCK